MHAIPIGRFSILINVLLAFWDCSGLTSITIPDSVMSIGEYAFAYCSSLTSITIPDSVMIVKDYIFNSCTNLETIYCEAKSKPNEWSGKWNNCYATVVWGYKGE